MLNTFNRNNKEKLAKINYGLIILLVISSLMGIFSNIKSLVSLMPYINRQIEPGLRFALFLADLPENVDEIKFMSNKKGDAYFYDLYQAQYVFVPAIVASNSDSEFIIATGYSKSEIKDIQSKLKTRIIRELPGNIYLLKK